MLIFRGLRPSNACPVALTIGNFDGVHLGHQTLLAELCAQAKARGLPSAVVVFEPHPREYFAPAQAPARLTSMREKLELFEKLGVDRVHVCRFNRGFAELEGEDFARALYEDAEARYVLIGDDFRFGRGRGGDFALMKEVGARHGAFVEAMHSVLFEGVRVSSTRVREALAAGDAQAAASYLGRPYSISGRVGHGDGMGRQLGYPTANIQLKHNRPPLSGIFVVRVFAEEEGAAFNGVASLGVRPTLKQDGKPVLEVHLFNCSQTLYHRHLRVDFLHKLRDEVKFPDVESLKRQIAQDVNQARSWFEENDGRRTKIPA